MRSAATTGEALLSLYRRKMALSSPRFTANKSFVFGFHSFEFQEDYCCCMVVTVAVTELLVATVVWDSCWSCSQIGAFFFYYRKNKRNCGCSRYCCEPWEKGTYHVRIVASLIPRDFLFSDTFRKLSFGPEPHRSSKLYICCIFYLLV
ncbi:uncharacterized protein LOC130983008 [Arachis stenosperma]|uniref:uncharacterized protein LOC130983008 n=1 Tax=Arachis stenosperma TaxID=217475 RepID=UPI0025AB9E3E|nr:uncharacterized protein LOC130983008 [Arachis stenosperma]